MAFVDTTDLEDAYSMVAPYVNGAPFTTVLHHLREAAIDFCARTLCWRVTLAPVLTVVDKSEYALKLPDQSKLVKLLRYNFDGQDQDPGVVTPDQGADLRDHATSTDAIWTEDRLNFKVAPIPKAAGKAMVITVALKPSADACSIPSNIYEDFGNAIAGGAIGRIAAIPRQSFSDIQQAALYTGQFNDAINRAVLQVARGFGRTRHRVRGHFF